MVQKEIYGKAFKKTIPRKDNLVIYFFTFWTLTLVGQRPMESLARLSVHLTVRLSVRLSLSFLKTGSLILSDIVHDDS